MNRDQKGKDQADLLWTELTKILETDSQAVKRSENENGEKECFFIQTDYMRQWYLDFA
jgi:hypothetical protein